MLYEGKGREVRVQKSVCCKRISNPFVCVMHYVNLPSLPDTGFIECPSLDFELYLSHFFDI